MKLPQRTVVVVTILLSFLSTALGWIDSETLLCDLKIFVPFTYKGITTRFMSRGTQSQGFSHMAAAWMAMEQFNARDPSVVAELGEDIFQDCNITFDMGGGSSITGGNTSAGGIGTIFIDTSSAGHQGSQLLFQNTRGIGGGLPCALIGPFNDVPALSVATMASSARVPHIPTGGMDARLAEELANPYTSVIYPRMPDIASSLARFLALHERTNYIASIYALTDTASQLQEGIGIAFDTLKVKQRSRIGYLSSTVTSVPLVGQTIPDCLRQVKEAGYRTIIITMDDFVHELPDIANAAEEMGMNTKEYLWIFLPPFFYESLPGLLSFPVSMIQLVDPPMLSYANVQKLLAGAALIHPVEQFEIQPQDKFLSAWRSANESFVERLNKNGLVVDPQATLPLEEYEKASVEYFRANVPEPGSGFMFDAVISAGMGGCIAERRKVTRNESISSEEQIAGIRDVHFMGATGQIEFGLSAGLLGNVTSARLPDHVVIGIFNLFPPTSQDDGDLDGTDRSYVLTATYSDLLTREEMTEIVDGDDLNKFITVDEYRPFVFRDGTVTAPLLLRDPADENFLSPVLRYVGLSMMGFALGCCFAFGIWVFMNSSHRIIVASQPHFLYLLIFGAMLSSLAIFGISTDENWGFNEEQLGGHCMSIVWLASIGHIVTYGALFTKLWRVNKVLQFSRREVNSSHVAWPSVLLMVVALTVLTVWQCVDPLQWVRVELDPVSGDSIGQCYSETMRYYICALGFILIIPTLLTYIMAWKTKDVDDTYSESSWIFTLVVVQLQVIFVAIPLIIVLRDVSTDGKYVGLLLLLWMMPISTISLIMTPKCIAHYKAIHGMNSTSTIRGSTGGVRISGMQNNSTASKRTSDPKSYIVIGAEEQKAEDEDEADGFAEE